MPKVYLHGRVYTKRPGMDGPFQYPNDRVLYFDRAEQLYYDPTSDYYVYEDEMALLKQSVFDLVAKEY